MQTHKFRGSVTGAAPLLIQVTAPSHIVYIVGFIVSGDNASGSASKPVLSRPSSPGTGTGTAITLSPSGPSAVSALATSFSVTPSLPTVISGTFNLPMRVNWNATPGGEMVLAQGAAGLLYAAASGGHTWSGSLTWEER